MTHTVTPRWVKALSEIVHVCGTVNFSSHNQMREAIEASLEIAQKQLADESPVEGREAGAGVSMIAAERQRQIDVEKWDYSHDDVYKHGEMIGAAVCYAMNALKHHGYKVRAEVYVESEKDFLVNSGDRGDRPLKKGGWQDAWPWSKEWDKRYKHDKLRSLVIAGALIAAEIDRMNPQPIPPAAPPSSAEGAYWWCEYCKEEVDASRVTFEEFHDKCGHTVKSITPSSSDTVKEQGAVEWTNVADGVPENLGWTNDNVLFITEKGTAHLGCYDYEFSEWSDRDGGVVVEGVVKWIAVENIKKLPTLKSKS